MVRRVLRDPELIDKSELSGRNNHNGREADSCEGLLLTSWFFKEIKMIVMLIDSDLNWIKINLLIYML